MFIYLTTNIKDGKRYVGQSSFLVEDKPNYIGSGKKFIAALKYHGKENFTRVILERDIKHLDVLNEREVYWIAYYKTYDNARDYNLTKGGDGSVGHKHTVNSKTQMTQSQLSFYETEAGIARKAEIKEWATGRKQTKEHKAKSGANSKAYWASEKGIAKRKELNEQFKGVKRDSAIGTKISITKKGSKHSEESKAKMVIAAKNRPPVSKETRAKLSGRTPWNKGKKQ